MPLHGLRDAVGRLSGLADVLSRHAHGYSDTRHTGTGSDQPAARSTERVAPRVAGTSPHSLAFAHTNNRGVLRTTEDARAAITRPTLTAKELQPGPATPAGDVG
jgi:hypothetical protein